MTHTLETLERRLRILEDREAIRDLVARYGPLADRGDAGALARLWVPDGVYEVAGFARAEGHAAIAALIDGAHHRALMADGCAHMLGPVAVTLDGDEATAVCHSVVFRSVSGQFVAERVSANRWTLVRTDQGWRVQHRANALLDGEDAARALLSL